MKTDEKKLDNLRHSCAHLLAAAVLDLWPKTLRTIGPAIENGFYYDFDFGDTKISEDDFPKIEEKMRTIAAGFLINGEIMKTKIGDLSEGQKGLVAFARLVIENPGILILDEPTNHINFRHIPVIAAALTGLMILLFLGSWRSTLIVLISIPLSIMVSILALSALGETINLGAAPTYSLKEVAELLIALNGSGRGPGAKVRQRQQSSHDPLAFR